MFDVVFFSTVGAKIIFLTSASTELLLYCVILEVRCYLENHWLIFEPKAVLVQLVLTFAVTHQW